MNLIRNTYLTNRVFYLFSACIVVLALGFVVPLLLVVGWCLFGLIIGAILWDARSVFRKKTPLRAQRTVTNIFSLFDPNLVSIQLFNDSDKALNLRLIDELPVQFQERDFVLELAFEANGEKSHRYELTPTKRGEYHFGNINAFMSTELGLVERRLQLAEPQTVKVYPSIVQMRAFELMVFSADRQQIGIKKTRRLGHGYEFSDIRSYVTGDDPRSINWKASSRSTDMMVNNYQDERSQQIYTVINTSRVMRMPFGGLSLMDYAINAALSLQNIVLQNQDHAGLITFSSNGDKFVRAERKFNQRQLMLESLYNIREDQGEPSYQALNETVQKEVRGRSMLLLFTNFLSYNSLMRALPELRRLNRNHLLVVVFFKNTELADYEQQEVKTMLDIASNVMAAKLQNELTQVIYELRNAGIQAIQTAPEDLTSNTINKYLELKSRGLV